MTRAGQWKWWNGWMALGLMLAAVQSHPPAARSDDRLPHSVNALVDALGAPSYRARAEAETLLKQQSPGVLATLEGRLVGESNPEIRQRLTEVVRHLFLKGETNFTGAVSVLGISLNAEMIGPREIPTPCNGPEMVFAVADAQDDFLSQRPARVGLQPGFPAAEVLRCGDRIEAIDHVALPLVDDEAEIVTFFRQRIQAYAPGSLVSLTVLRNHRRINVAVRLAGIPEENMRTEQVVEPATVGPEGSIVGGAVRTIKAADVEGFIVGRSARAAALVASLTPANKDLVVGPARQGRIIAGPVSPQD